MTEQDFDAELDADLDSQETEEPDFAVVPVLINGKLRRLKFTQMDGLAWADICDRNDPRTGVKIDTAFGYNVAGAATLAAAASGRIQSGEEWKTLTPERWKRVIRNLSGAHLRAVADAVFQLNQYGPALAVLEAGKAYAVESAMKSFSPALSESPAVDSSKSGPAAT
jgi:hypothetical protein